MRLFTHSTLLLLLFSAVMGAYGVELAFHLSTYQHSFLGNARRQVEGVFGEVVRVREAGVEAYPMSNGHHVVNGAGQSKSLRVGEQDVFPLAWLPGTMSIISNEEGGFTHVQTDERGFRNPPGMWPSKDIPYAVIGSSLCLGVQEYEKTIQAKLATDGHQVLSGCLAGIGPLYSLAIFREFFRDRTLRYVFLVVSPDFDRRELVADMQSPILKSYLDPSYSQNLLTIEPELSRAVRQVIDGVYASKLLEFQDLLLRLNKSYVEYLTIFWKDWLLLRELRTKLGLQINSASVSSQETSKGPRPRAGIDDYRQVITRLRADSARVGGELVLVFLPVEDEIRGDLLRTDQESLEMFRQLSVPVIDTTAALRSSPPHIRLFTERGHFTAAGNIIIADQISHFVNNPYAAQGAR